MGNTEHTPGPWATVRGFTQDGHGDTPTIFIEGPRGQSIAAMEVVSTNGGPFLLPTNADANARLIASAPELAEALVALLKMADETRYDTEPCNWSADAKLARLDRLRKARAALAKAGVL